MASRPPDHLYLYLRKVLSVFTGAAIAQAIPIVGSLLIARIYAPSAFGAFSEWLGISLVVSVFITLRLEAATGLEPEGKLRTELVFVTVLTTILAGSTVGVIALFVVSSFSSWVHISTCQLLLLSLHSIGAALSLIWQSWTANNGDIKHLSLIRVTQAGSTTLLQIAGGYYSPTEFTLCVAQTVGVWLTVAVCWYVLPIWTAGKLNFKRICRLLCKHWSKYRRFPQFSLPADLLNSAAAQLPVVFLSHRFGPEVAGYYALAVRTMGAPISILGGSIRDVFKNGANEEYRSFGNCRIIYRRTFYILLVPSMFMVMLTIPFAEPIFRSVFGHEWIMSGTIAGWLVPLFSLRFIASPLSYTFYIAQKQHVDLIWQLSLAAVTLATLLSFATYRSTIIAYSTGYAFLYVVYIALSYRYSGSAQNPAPR